MLMDARQFFELAQKVVHRRATRAERESLDAVLRAHPELRPDFDEMKRAAGWRDDEELREELRGRLAADDAGDLREEADDASRREAGSLRPRSRWRDWRWWARLALVLAVCAVIFGPDFIAKPRAVIQLGIVQGTNAPPFTSSQEMAQLQALAPETLLTTAQTSEDMKKWEDDWPAGSTDLTMVKVVYDRPAAELRVNGVHEGRRFQNRFPVEKGLTAALQEAHEFIRKEIR